MTPPAGVGDTFAGPAPRGTRSSASRRWRGLLAVVASLAILLAVVLVVDGAASVPRGVRIGGVDVGGSSPEAADRPVTARAAEEAGKANRARRPRYDGSDQRGCAERAP